MYKVVADRDGEVVQASKIAFNIAPAGSREPTMFMVAPAPDVPTEGQKVARANQGPLFNNFAYQLIGAEGVFTGIPVLMEPVNAPPGRYSCHPSLPPGLSINATGVISGSCKAFASNQFYKVTVVTTERTYGADLFFGVREPGSDSQWMSLPTKSIDMAQEFEQKWGGQGNVLVKESDVYDFGWPFLMEAFQVRKDITQLHLRNNKIMDDVAMDIAKVLQTNETLYRLDLADNNISCIGISAIAEALKVNKSLKHIYLVGNNIKDDGAMAIAKVLKTNKILKEITLGSNSISDLGAVAIAQALESNEHVFKVNLDNTCMTDIGALAFAKAVKANMFLRRIDIHQSRQFGDVGKNALEEAKKARERNGKPLANFEF